MFIYVFIYAIIFNIFLIDNVSGTVKPGQFLAIIGASGNSFILYI